MSIEAGQYFDIWRLLSEPRSDNEAVLRSLCRSVYLGNDTALCRVLGRYKMYVDTRDVSISSHLMLEGYWEMWVTEAMMRHVRPGMTVLDIGANLGYFTMLLADLVGPTGRVLAFEPNPEMAGRARRSVGLNGFAPTTTVHEMALGASDGVMLLDVVDDMPGGAHLVPLPLALNDEMAAPELPVPAKAMRAVFDFPEPTEAPILDDWQPPRTAVADAEPRWPRPAPAAPGAITLPPQPAAPQGLLARLAARLGFVPAEHARAMRAQALEAIEQANAEINAAAQVRIEAAIVEAIAAGEMAAGARIAAADAAGAAHAAAAAARAIHAESAAVTRTMARAAVAAMQQAADAAQATQAEALAAIAKASEALERRVIPDRSGRSLPRVPVRRLDEIHGAIDADFIKMDVEGAEYLVWSGMGGLLARGRALTIFMEFTIARFGDPHAFLDEIMSHGFSMAIIEFNDGIVPISREDLFKRSHHVDNMLVFARPALADAEAQQE